MGVRLSCRQLKAWEQMDSLVGRVEQEVGDDRRWRGGMAESSQQGGEAVLTESRRQWAAPEGRGL